MRRRTSRRSGLGGGTHRVTVSVEESNVLKRVALLNAAVFKVITDTRLVRVDNADYETGDFEFLIEAEGVTVPDIAPGEVVVRIERITALAA